MFSAFFIWSEKGLKRKVWALIVFLLSGILGIVVLSSIQIKDPLFPLLSGLFGLSTLIISMSGQQKIVEQKIDDTVEFGSIWSHAKAAASSALMAVLPALGAAQATILAQFFSRKKSAEEFLIIVGGINTVSVLFVLTTLFLINKARTGVIATMQQFLTLDFSSYSILLAASFAAVGIAVLLTMHIGKFAANKISRVPYRKISLAIILFIIILIAIFSGPMGLFVLSVSTAIGLIAPKAGIKRIHAMGVLVLPVVIYFI